LAVMALTYDFELSMVFIADGVWQLVREQNSEAIALKNLAKLYQVFEHFGCRTIYVEKKSLVKRNLTEQDLVVPVKIISARRLAALQKQQDIIINL
jgi:tRNA 2-thiouridine synthesizing protein C